MRAAAEGVRVFAVAIVVGVAIGTGDIVSIAILSALTLLYTFEGGLAAVIWTDVVQMFLYVAGSLVALATVCHKIPGGWTGLVAGATAAHKLTMLHFSWSVAQTYTFQAGVIGGCFLTMASHGTDQLMVQRLLAAKNLFESRVALLASGMVIFFQFGLFLFIGAGLWVYYGHGSAAPAAGADRIFPAFIVSDMPAGIAGLMIAAILAAAMSNLSAALNSLTSSSMVDFYLPETSRNAGAGARQDVARDDDWLGRRFVRAGDAVKARRARVGAGPGDCFRVVGRDAGSVSAGYSEPPRR